MFISKKNYKLILIMFYITKNVSQKMFKYKKITIYNFIKLCFIYKKCLYTKYVYHKKLQFIILKCIIQKNVDKYNTVY